MRWPLLLASVLAAACGPRRVRVDADVLTGGEDGPALVARADLGQPPPRDAALAPADAAPDLAEPMPDEALAPDALQERDGAAPDVAAGACPFAFCEDFEGVVIGMPPDPRVWTRAGNILVEAAPGGRPGRAMHVRAGMTPLQAIAWVDRPARREVCSSAPNVMRFRRRHSP